MTYGVISDIHGNLPALERVLDALTAAQVDTYLCLGDIVGYGASPNECCELIQDIEALCIRGNHEQAVLEPDILNWFNPDARACLIWTREQLTSSNREFLASLQPITETDNFILCHGSIIEPNFYITSPYGALPSMQVMTSPLAFFGHTHCAEWFVWADHAELPEQHSYPAGGLCSLESSAKYLINPGAVGQPRDGNPQAAFAIYDEPARQVELHRIDYDIAAAQEQMTRAGLPLSMIQRLSLGA